MRVELWSITPDAESLIARAARVSRRGDTYATFGEADRALIERLIAHGHDSVLEHASATFLIEGISRACLAQLTRHRLASFTVESQRYVNMDNQEVVIPPSVANHEDVDSPVAEKFKNAILEANKTYCNLRASGVPLEDARYVLPQATTTRLVATANFREWRHIIRLRTAPDAQWEIRGLMEKIREILGWHAPSVFGGGKTGMPLQGMLSASF